MSTPSVPQYSDIEVIFDDIQYDVDPVTVDLTDLDDIIFSLTAGSPTSAPTLILKNSIDSSRFVIDNTNKEVKVRVFAAEVTDTLGRYACNLWLVSSDIHMTHPVKFFVVKPAVNYQ